MSITPVPDRLAHWDAHHRFFASTLAAIVAVLIIPSQHLFLTRLVAGWIVYAGVWLGLSWNTMYGAEIDHIRTMAEHQDTGRRIIFVLVLTGACISLIAIGWLLSGAKTLSRDRLVAHIILSIVSILYSWLLIHTTFAFHYAHRYYGGEHHGLSFPGNEDPDYLDFCYFSFVIGMTSQVSDVAISSRPMRRLVLLHSILSFIFNTLILALSINLLSTLL